MTDAPRIGSLEYFQRLRDVEERHWWSLGMRDIAGALLDTLYRGRTGLRILDAGCGTGIMMTWLGRYSRPLDVEGIDISEHALAFCRQRGLPRVARASALDLPYAADAFDLVVCNDVIQHLPDAAGDAAALREFFRVLAPGGCLLIRTNSRCGWRAAQLSGTADYRKYSRELLERATSEAGFAVLRASYVNMVMSFGPIVRRYLQSRADVRYQDQGLRVRALPAWLAPANAALRLLLRMEGWLIARTPLRMPFGNSLVLLARKAARQCPRADSPNSGGELCP